MSCAVVFVEISEVEDGKTGTLNFNLPHVTSKERLASKFVTCQTSPPKAPQTNTMKRRINCERKIPQNCLL